MIRTIIVTVSAAALLAACSSGNKMIPVITTAPPSLVASMSAATFVDLAASAALYSIEAAKLAEARSRDRGVLDVARMQRQAGEAIGGQLAFAGPRVDAVPDNELTPDHQKLLNTLRTASDFDRVYMAQQMQVVPQAQQLHHNYSVLGGSATLRPVAAFGRDKLEEVVKVIERAN